MEELIKQAFLRVEVIGPMVQKGHYDLIGPSGEIILPQVWDTLIEPDWTITMFMWPPPEKPKGPPPDDYVHILNADSRQKPHSGPSMRPGFTSGHPMVPPPQPGQSGPRGLPSGLPPPLRGPLPGNITVVDNSSTIRKETKPSKPKKRQGKVTKDSDCSSITSGSDSEKKLRNWSMKAKGLFKRKSKKVQKKEALKSSNSSLADD